MSSKFRLQPPEIFARNVNVGAMIPVRGRCVTVAMLGAGSAIQPRRLALFEAAAERGPNDIE